MSSIKTILLSGNLLLTDKGEPLWHNGSHLSSQLNSVREREEGRERKGKRGEREGGGGELIYTVLSSACFYYCFNKTSNCVLNLDVQISPLLQHM